MFELRTQKYRATLKDDALSWQVGFWRFICDNHAALLLGTSERDKVVLAAMSNWVFLFGEYGPKIKEQPSLKPAVDDALDLLRCIIDLDLSVEFTLAIIIAAAAQDIHIDKFKLHFDKLYELVVITRAINIYGLEARLAQEHRQYYYHMQYGSLG